MDEVSDPEKLPICAVIADHAERAIEAHDVRSRTAGRVTFVEFHLVVPATMAVGGSHEICDRIETALHEEIGETVVSIHVEPEGEAKHRGAGATRRAFGWR